MLNVGGNANFGRRPPAVVCQICGRLFGTASISIHMKTCTAKFLEEEARKPKAQRRALPQAALEAGVGGGAGFAALTPDQLDAHNDQAMKNFNDAVLQKCANCGRTFLPDRLAIHHRSCTSENPARRVGDKGPSNGGAPTTYNVVGVTSPAAAGSGARTEASPARPTSSAAGQRPATSAAGAAPAPSDASRKPAPAALEAQYIAAATGMAEPSQPRTPSRRSSGAAVGAAAAGRRPSGGVMATLSRVAAASQGHSRQEKSLETEWRTSVAERLALLATRLAYLQETLLSEVADIQEEVSDLADEIAGEAEEGAGGWRPSSAGGASDGKGDD